MGGWKLGEKVAWWDWIPLVRVLKAAKEKFLPEPVLVKEQPEPMEQTLAFLEVDPAKGVEKPPQNALYQSAVSTEAANPKPSDYAAPKVEGIVRDDPKITENRKESAKVLKPSPSVESNESEDLNARPREKKEIGDMALAKPQEKTQEDTGKSESKEGEADRNNTRRRPKTLAEAKGGSYGEKSKQEGGVRKYDISASLAARGTLLGDYDAQLIDAVRQKWYSILDRARSTEAGKVVIEFTLHYDGRVSDVKVVETSVSDLQSLYCEMAIREPSPYKKWPMELRRELKGDVREVRFTFFYE